MKKYLKDGLIYAIVKYLITILAFLKSLLIASTLGPSLLGSYAYIMLLGEYISYYNLGVFASMNREVAINIGDDSKKEYNIQVFNVSLSFSITLGILILILYLLYWVST